MRNDFTVFWQNNTRAQALFQELLSRAERGAYDDEFLQRLAAYREESPESERADIFAAQYLLHHADPEGAAACGERAYQKRPSNYEVWKVLAKAYHLLGREVESIVMQGYAYLIYDASDLVIHLADDEMSEGFNRLGIALTTYHYAPLVHARPSIEDGQLIFCHDTFIGEPLSLDMPKGSQRFWVACYAEDTTSASDKAVMMETMRHSEWFTTCGHRDFVFDLQKAQEVHGAVRIEVPAGKEMIVPIAGTKPLQDLLVQTKDSEKTAYLGKWSFNLFRFSESTTLHTDENVPYVVASPILLGHHANRKKLVLNILVDGLSWPVVRQRFPDCMPHIAKFFSRGVIFDQNFSTSEYTYPALPAIETGRYPQRSHIFNDHVVCNLSPDMLTLAECMKDLGYYCAAPMASGCGLYCGTMRGYDRLITTSWHLPASVGAERTIRHIETFDETDQFLFLHVTDVHPWNAKMVKIVEDVAAHLPLSERLFIADPSIKSVHLPELEIYKQQFWKCLTYVDRSIGQLLAYIEEHFAEDAYIINLYSDHGNSIFTPPREDGGVDVMSEYGTGAAWMMRSAGIPQGVVSKELTSIVDIYPTLGRLCGFPVAPDIDGNLPAVFGGQERDAVYSMSMFPGQTYKLAVRNAAHVFRLETEDPVDEDGSVDFAKAKMGIYMRGHDWAPAYETDSEELRAFFYPRARDFIRTIANNGEFWPSMRATRRGSADAQHP